MVPHTLSVPNESVPTVVLDFPSESQLTALTMLSKKKVVKLLFSETFQKTEHQESSEPFIHVFGNYKYRSCRARRHRQIITDNQILIRAPIDH